MHFDQAFKIYNAYRKKFKTSLTAEQQALQAEIDEIRKTHLDPVHAEKLSLIHI